MRPAAAFGRGWCDERHSDQEVTRKRLGRSMSIMGGDDLRDDRKTQAVMGFHADVAAEACPHLTLPPPAAAL